MPHELPKISDELLLYITEQLKKSGDLPTAAPVLLASEDQPAATAGLSNANIILESPVSETQSVKFVLRLYPANALRPLHRNEATVLLYLDSHAPGLAPKCYLRGDTGFHGALRPWAILEFILNVGAVQPQEIVHLGRSKAAAEILGKIHHSLCEPEACAAGRAVEGIETVPGDDVVVPDTELIGKDFMRGCGDDAYAEQLKATWAKVLDVSTKHGELFASLPRTALVHGDTHCGNFLKCMDAMTLRLVDWEAAHIGCELEDVGSLLVVAVPPFSAEQESDFLDEYLAAVHDSCRAWIGRLRAKGNLKEAVALYKMRKLCRIIAFFNAAVDAMDGEARKSGVGAGMLGGARFFLSLLDGILGKL
jgi:aminoglycoside phosphotransferase (APT) family kinase protein